MLRIINLCADPVPMMFFCRLIGGTTTPKEITDLFTRYTAHALLADIFSSDFIKKEELEDLITNINLALANVGTGGCALRFDGSTFIADFDLDMKDNDINNVGHILFDINHTEEVDEIEGTINWNKKYYTQNIDTGLGATLQVGQELLLRAKNGALSRSQIVGRGIRDCGKCTWIGAWHHPGYGFDRNLACSVPDGRDTV